MTVATKSIARDSEKLAGTTPTAAGLALLDDADAAAQRTTLGLGSLATQNGLAAASAALSVDVDITNANQYYDGPSLSLAAGTWLVFGHATFRASGTGVHHYTIRITDGTNHFGSVQHSSVNGTSFTAGLQCAGLVTIASTTTIKLQAATHLGNSVMRAETSTNPSGNNATQIVAVKVA